VQISIVVKKISADVLQNACSAWFGDMVKIVVDVKRKLIALGGDLHADAESLLLQNGSQQKDLWGANFYPWQAPEHRIEYTALINIRPQQNNVSIEILDPVIRQEIKKIVENLLLGADDRVV
jgi:hypothetical protein